MQVVESNPLVNSDAMDEVEVKQEIFEQFRNNTSTYANKKNASEIPVIDLDSSDESEAGDSPSSSGDEDTRTNGKRSRVSGEGTQSNKRKKPGENIVLPGGFLDPLPPKSAAASTMPHASGKDGDGVPLCNKQFWKAGDFEGGAGGDWDTSSGGIDHVRVHPRFLHSNATSHKWVLGAFAELLDNALDEVCNGATYVKIDMLENKKAGTRMLLIEDNGGGMDPDKMRQCMSLGYSLKSKVADTIGQYGNGFKTSTMRLGADVIVFSRCSGKDGKRSTQSIGLLSYTFLRTTGKEDIIVPMLDYERDGQEWKKLIRSSAIDWERNVEAMAQWSPFSSEADLMRQFDHMKDQGTRIIIYNLWEDDQGQLELDFDTDQHDIQIRGVNRDPKSIQMATQFPNSRHFLTYRHSLRSYAAILYLRVPPGFRMILRGKDVEHHNIVNDMMMTNVVTYRPQPGADGIPKDTNMVAIVTMGFVKDAKAHIDVQGFNVYHKNRLIKPFWRLWNAAGSDGRGVIGVLEANFVEPAHDKQGFERTIVLSRLETRLIQMQKTYWSTYCHKIGYAPRRNKKNLEDSESSFEYTPETPAQSKKKSAPSSGKILGSLVEKLSLHKHQKQGMSNASRHPTAAFNGNGFLSNSREKGNNSRTRFGKGASSLESTSPFAEDIGDDDLTTTVPMRQTNGNSQKSTSAQESFPRDGPRTVRPARHVGQSEAEQDVSPGGNAMQIVTRSHARAHDVSGNSAPPKSGNIHDVSQNSAPPKSCDTPTLDQLMEENRELKERLKRREEEISGDLLHDLECERNRCKSLEAQEDHFFRFPKPVTKWFSHARYLEAEKQKNEALNKEQEGIINIFSEERERRDVEEEKLRKKLKEASVTIQELVERVKQLELEKMKSQGNKWGR